MKIAQSNKIISIVTFSVLTMFTFCTARADVSETITKSFEVKPNGTLVIESDLGSIHVESSASNSVSVEVKKIADVFGKSKGEDLLKKFTITFNQKNNDVFINGKFEEGLSGFFGDLGRKIKVHYEVKVPEKYNVDLKTAGGSVTVGNLNGDAKCKTAGGSLEFGTISGDINGKTAGGSIDVNQSGGSVDVETAGGSINIGDVDGHVNARTAGGSISVKSAGGNVNAKTAGGSVHIGKVAGYVDASTSGGSVEAHITSALTEDCKLSTSGGSVRVSIPADIGVDIDARTFGGKVHLDMPVTVQGDVEKSAIHGTINGGGPTLQLRTSAGNIYIDKGPSTAL